MKPRQIKTTPWNGRTLVHVPLGGVRGEGKEATLYKEDWKELTSEFEVSQNWFSIRGIVTALAPDGRPIVVARAIVDAPRGSRVHYKDNDTLNLRRDNLIVKERGWSKHHDREHLWQLLERRREEERLRRAILAEHKNNKKGTA